MHRNEPEGKEKMVSASAQTPRPSIEALFNQAFQAHRAGRLTEAERLYRQVLSADCRHADSLHLLGLLAHQVGKPTVAAELIARAISINGTAAFYHSNLGNVLKDLGRLDEAVAAYGTALRIDPDLAEAQSNLGNALRELGRLDEAVAAYRAALRAKPDSAEAYANLGNALKDLGQLDEAVAGYRAALGIRGDLAEAHSNLSATLKELGRFDDAVTACKAAICIRPDYAEAYFNLGNVRRDLGRLVDGAAALRTAIRIKPDYARAHSNLGTVHSDLGHLEDATAAFDAAIRTDPDYAGAYSNLLLSLHYRAEVTGAAILAQARRFAARFEAPSRHFANTADPNRRLRIGYVSGDYCRHSVAYFLAPVLSHHDRTSVQVFCYSTGAKTDDMTERLQSGADQWRSLVGVSDEAGSKMVIADGIDVLVDLSGHTALNRLTLFARKAAPVQVSWLGYPGTTGLTAMDYRLVDVVSDPEDEDGTHTSETLIRLRDGFLCYGPPAEAPEPKMPEGCGYPVSFGSFNNLAKLSADTFEVWAALLDRVHGARLVLKGRPFADPAVRLLVRERFRERGVAPERVVLIEHLSATAEHLAAYNEVDIGLDPFPYNGTTTTCEALWMGVPVVTLRGDRHSGRVGASLLTQMGLEDLIARDTEDYLRIAVTLADDDKRRNELRRTLRARMAASSLCNGPAFARKLEEAYRKIWRDWCARQS